MLPVASSHIVFDSFDQLFGVIHCSEVYHSILATGFEVSYNSPNLIK
jgi:hypothetical protein